MWGDKMETTRGNEGKGRDRCGGTGSALSSACITQLGPSSLSIFPQQRRVAMDPFSQLIFTISVASFVIFQWLFHKGSPWVSTHFSPGFLSLSDKQKVEWNSRWTPESSPMQGCPTPSLWGPLLHPILDWSSWFGLTTTVWSRRAELMYKLAPKMHSLTFCPHISCHTALWLTRRIN